MVTVPEPIKLQWDSGNALKNLLKHRVAIEECEQVFTGSSNFLYDDPSHSGREARYVIIGPTQINRLLFIAFTLRQDFVRIISARDADKKERRLYEEAQKMA